MYVTCRDHEQYVPIADCAWGSPLHDSPELHQQNSVILASVLANEWATTSPRSVHY